MFPSGRPGDPGSGPTDPSWPVDGLADDGTEPGPTDWTWPADAPSDDRSGNDSARPGRWWWLLAAGVVPWVVAGLLGLRGGLGGAPTTPVTGTPAPSPTSLPGPEEHEPRTPTWAPPTTAGASGAAGVAVVVAHAWLNGLGPAVSVAGIEPVTGARVDHIEVVAVEQAGPRARVVTLLAVLLHQSSGHLTSASVRRLAVPVTVGRDGPRPAGPPWWLPTPALRPRPPRTRDVHDTGLWVEAGAALTAAGYGGVAVEGLERAGPGRHVVTARGSAPGWDRISRHRVWLVERAGRLVVAGTAGTASR